MKKIKDILNYTLIIIMAVVLISFAYTKYTEGIPSVGGYRLLYVPTGSMEPTISAHSFIIGKSIAHTDYKEGDICTYKYSDGNSSMHIVHRIIGTNADGQYIFKGDNNMLSDPKPVEAAQIDYKIVFY